MHKILIFSLLWGSISFAGDKVGNGGGLWTCSLNNNLTNGMLVDLYEAEVEFGLNLISTSEKDPMRIALERKDFIQINLLAYFFRWEKIWASSLSKIRYVNSELAIIDDFLYRVKPLSSTCNEAWVYTQFANFTNQQQILIRQDLWNSPVIGPVHKAALIWHEVIYTWLRQELHDQDSVRARQIVGILFSSLSGPEMMKRIDKLIQSTPSDPTKPYWFCRVHNYHTLKNFSEYGETEAVTKMSANQKCNNEPYNFGCDDGNARCELVKLDGPKITCQVTNGISFKSFLATTRSILESEFKAKELCQADAESVDFVHCENTMTCVTEAL